MEITLRDLVALVVIHGLTSNPNLNSRSNESLVRCAYSIADEVVKQRDDEEEEETTSE